MLEVSAKRVWCNAARSSQKVVVIDVAKLPVTMRKKLDNPDAAGIWCGGIPSRMMESNAIKNIDMATPCTNSGIM